MCAPDLSLTLPAFPLPDEFLWALIQNLNADYPAACNNATWALGEVAMHMGACRRLAALPARLAAPILDPLIPSLSQAEN